MLFLLLSFIQTQHLRSTKDCSGPFCGMKEGYDLFTELVDFPKIPKEKDICPMIHPVRNFNLFINRPWYVQMLGYNDPTNELSCLTTTYRRRLDGLIGVSYMGRRKGIDGPIIESNALCLKQLDNRIEGQLGIQSCYLFFFGLDHLAMPYWILDYDPFYNWMIVIAGQPNIKQLDGSCYPSWKSPHNYIGSGLWLMTKQQNPSKITLFTMLYRLRSKGISTRFLTTIPQKGCY